MLYIKYSVLQLPSASMGRAFPPKPFYNLFIFLVAMEIISSNFRKGTAILRITDLEDLWYLSHLIDPGDFVRGKTTRKMKIGADDQAKVTRKTITLTIEAEDIELSPAGNVLKINGKIKEGPDDIPKGSYHSLSLEEGTEFSLEKVQWLQYQKQKLQEASEKKYKYLICIHDREEALFALTKSFGFEVLTKIKGQVPKKAKTNEVTKDFYQEIINTLSTYWKRYNPESIIVASPAFYKEDLLKKVTDKELKIKIVLAICSDVSEKALDEVIKRPELEKVLKSSRAREEELLMDELLSEINKNNLAVYGWEEVKKASTGGAINKLLLTDNFIKKRREQGKYEEVDEIMKHTDHLKGEIHLLTSEQEGGKKLDGLGGIAALTRYRLGY